MGWKSEYAILCPKRNGRADTIAQKSRLRLLSLPGRLKRFEENPRKVRVLENSPHRRKTLSERLNSNPVLGLVAQHPRRAKVLQNRRHLRLLRHLKSYLKNAEKNLR